MPNRFDASIVEVGIKQYLRQLELVIVDMLNHTSFTEGAESLYSQEILLRVYFAGVRDKIFSEGVRGTFDSTQVDIRKGQQ